VRERSAGRGIAGGMPRRAGGEALTGCLQVGHVGHHRLSLEKPVHTMPSQSDGELRLPALKYYQENDEVDVFDSGLRVGLPMPKEPA
jgi:hypothetical protein